jgi:hypothetical protein
MAAAWRNRPLRQLGVQFETTFRETNVKSRRVLIRLVVALFFCGVNFYSYYQMPEYSTIDDGCVYFGWPFSLYASGGYAGVSLILWTGLIGDLFVALAAIRLLDRLSAKWPSRPSENATVRP